MSLLRITETPRRTRIFAGVLALSLLGCGRRSPRDDAAVVAPLDAADAARVCEALFDRYHATIAVGLHALAITETADAARARDREGLARCIELPAERRACLTRSPVTPDTWATCQVDPMFTLFDATRAREALFGVPVTAAESTPRVAALVGTWERPARGLDDAVTWTIEPTGRLLVRRTSPTAKPARIDEPPRQIAFARERLVGLTLGGSTQFVPLVRIGDTLRVSFTSGALAVRVTDESAFALDLADHDRWVTWSSTRCSVLDPHRGVAPATCAWTQTGDTRAFTIESSDVHQRWEQHDGLLVHPAMETFSKR